jgi:hypothetical protein
VIGPDEERARPAAGPAFADAVTVSFGDRRADLYGLLRVGLSGAPDGRAGSALALLFSRRRPVGVLAQGGVPLAADADWGRLAVAGVELETRAPLARWRAAYAGVDGTGVEVELEAFGPPAEVGPEAPAARAGGLEGYEQLCQVRGRARVDGRAIEIDALGQRGHRWGAPDWDRVGAVRTLSAWLPDGGGVALTAVRPAKARHHADDLLWAAVFGPDGPADVAEPRLSTVYDREGRQRHAGLELWVREDDDHPRRATGEALCGSTVDLGQLALDCAFFAWRMDGLEGVGRYDVLRRTQA